MMQPFKAKGGTHFNFNSDMSGDVRIHTVPDDIAHVDGADLMEFVRWYAAEYGDADATPTLADALKYAAQDSRRELVITSAQAKTLLALVEATPEPKRDGDWTQDSDGDYWHHPTGATALELTDNRGCPYWTSRAPGHHAAGVATTLAEAKRLALEAVEATR